MHSTPQPPPTPSSSRRRQARDWVDAAGVDAHLLLLDARDGGVRAVAGLRHEPERGVLHVDELVVLRLRPVLFFPPSMDGGGVFVCG